MYIYVYTYNYIDTDTFIYMFINTYAHIRTCKLTLKMFTYICIHIHMYIYKHICMCVHTSIYVCIYIHILYNICIFIHKHCKHSYKSRCGHEAKMQLPSSRARLRQARVQFCKNEPLHTPHIHSLKSLHSIPTCCQLLLFARGHHGQHTALAAVW